MVIKVVDLVICGYDYLMNFKSDNQQSTANIITSNRQLKNQLMKYLNAKDVYEELKNFEGKATFKGEETVIDYFVLLPKSEIDNFSLTDFLERYQASTSFEIEGSHEDETYTLLGISIREEKYSNDVDYFMKLLVW